MSGLAERSIAIQSPKHNPIQVILSLMLPMLGLLLLAQPALAAHVAMAGDMMQEAAQEAQDQGIFEKILDLFKDAPYIWIPVLMIAAGLGFPLPEEIILVFTGYLAYANPDSHHVGLLFTVCVASILVGDLVPFLLGRIFGPKILKIRLVRTWMHTERLARLNAFFEKNGRLTILLARFITGVRTPAFFTAGTMRMSIFRFLIMDGIGAVIGSALFIWLGTISGEKIDAVIHWIHKTEQGILLLVVVGTVALGVYLWYRHGRRQRLLGKEVRETFVQPSHALEEASETEAADEEPDRREIPVIAVQGEEALKAEEAERGEGAEPKDRLSQENKKEGWILPTERKNGEGS